jgi:quercetin dioxygenase-like cupin family protein
MMRIGILGSGLMGGKLGTIFARAGHDVVFSYARSQQKLKRLARDAGGNAKPGTPREAVQEKVIVTCSLSMNEPNKTINVKGINKMEIKRIGSQPSNKGPAEWFTGTVRIDPLFQAPAPARAAGASVTFEPGARTAWHTHPLGQTLIVTTGCGWVQREGGPIEEIRPGDVIWFPPGEKHWHGATPTTAMTHIAIQEQLDGKAVDWMEKVSDEQYQVHE